MFQTHTFKGNRVVLLKKKNKPQNNYSNKY